jgi:ABC-type molybdate transport system substrate-binding protein
MLKRLRHHIYGILAALLFAAPAQAVNPREISSVTVLADTHLAVVLSQLASEFARENAITISGTFGPSPQQEKRIEDGELADLFITADPALIQQLRVKGLVDIYSIGRIASHHDAHYMAAVVASENMTAARSFLAYLKSDKAREIFRKNGMRVP